MWQLDDVIANCIMLRAGRKFPLLGPTLEGPAESCARLSKGDLRFALELRGHGRTRRSEPTSGAVAPMARTRSEKIRRWRG
ncbi:MAG: hypothetical protein AMXMBFR33_31560 [Candidatus Xenobia bacterium]